MSSKLVEAWDGHDDWTGKKSPAERRRLQNRLNQRAYRRRRHHTRLALTEEPASSTPCLDLGRPGSKQLASSDGPPMETIFPGELPMFLLLKWPELRQHALKFLQSAFVNWSINLPRPQDLPNLSRLNAFDALARNAMILCIPYEYLETDEHNSLFNRYGPEHCSTPQALPTNLHPTKLQTSVIHHSWLDLFPFPKLRDNILRGLERGQLDEDELCDDLCCDLLNLNDDSIPSLLIWGDSWDAAGWEFSARFFRKWGFLLNDCYELIEVTNHWREKRGDERIECVLD